MKFLSVCSGIEAASLAWNPLGFEAVAFSEIESFQSSVLKYHYPGVVNLGDMTNFKEWSNESNVDVLIGGTPCQSFSRAGLRGGLDDPRGSLMLTFGAVARKYQPDWVVWENVEGVLSSNGGRDFGSFLGLLGELGYGYAYRVLNAQYFGVPQRRRRVFVVGYLGDWRRPASVLFEQKSLSGYSPESFVERSEDSRKIEERSRDAGIPKLARTLLSSNQRGDFIPTAYAMRGRDGGNMPEEIGDFTSPVRSSSGGSTRDLICFSSKDYGGDASINLSPTLRSGSHKNSHMNGGVPPAVAKDGELGYVRRLTPLECERLQGLPDGYTDVIWRGKPASDSRRYHAIGNSIAVPVLRKIGERILFVHNRYSRHEKVHNQVSSRRGDGREDRGV